MRRVDCTDIFDAVLLNVKRAYLAKYDAVSVRSKTVTQSGTEDENRSAASIETPKSETTVIAAESSSSASETVRESVERVKESEVIATLRREIEDKFPFALGAVCADLGVLDIAYRSYKDYEDQGEYSAFYIDTVDEFPLCERFAHPCVMFVSSMLLLDVNEAESDAFYEKYIAAVTAISEEIPPRCHEIAERYPF